MASRLPAAVDSLRRRRGGARDQGDVTAALRALQRHLDGVIEDPNDRAEADARLSNLLNAIGAPGEDDEGEAQGERLTASGQAPSVAGQTGFDHRGAVGLDHAFGADRGKRRTPSGLAALFAGLDAPRRAEAVK
jgi:hypothetical protein